MPPSRLLLGLVLSICLSNAVLGQAISDLPRAEYYVAKELYGVGRTGDAVAAFNSAIKVARRVGQDRWIDSIPPMVMLGECYYQQGNLALALEQYEAALSIGLAHPTWIDQIEVGVEQLPPLDALAKSPSWFARTQPFAPVAIPEGVQIAIDPTGAAPGPGGTIVAPVSLITRLDATEVLKTLGIAMMRRAQILGPLAKHSPMSAPLEKLFAHSPRQQAPWVHASWRVLRGISVQSLSGADSPELLREGVTILGKLDYFMSPLALLVLGQRDAREGKYQAAISNLQDASILAALFEQHVLLSESLRELSNCAAASHRADLIDPLQQAALWSAKNSPLSQLTAQLGAAELCVVTGNVAQAEKLLSQSNAGLRTRGVNLPRLQAQASYVTALVGFTQDRSTIGLNNLATALKLIRGTAASGPVVHRIYQSQQVLDLFADGRLTAHDTEALLSDLLAEPAPHQWQNEPLETLASITTSSLPAYERWLQLSVGNVDDAEMLRRMDNLQRQQLYEALPLGGRLFCWRAAVTADPQTLPADVRQIVQTVKANSPPLSTAPQQIQGLVDTLRAAPLPLDERQLTAEIKKTFGQLEDLSESFENLLALQCLSRIPLNRTQPTIANVELIQTRLAPGDVAVGLVGTSRQIFGVAISPTTTTTWQVSEAGVVGSKLDALLREIGLVRGPTGQPPAADDPNSAWRKTAAELHQLLFPATAQAVLADAKRIIIAPHGRLWYVPFELLPQRGDVGALPWLARHQISYVPTVGGVDLAYAPRVDAKATVGLIDGFFAIDKDQNSSLAEAIVSHIPNSHKILLNQKSTVPSATWLRLRTDQLWVAGTLATAGSGWETAIIPVGRARPPQLGTWLQTPHVAPARVVLPGYQSSMRSGQLQYGNDLLLPACAMLYGGSRTAIVSRWSAGGLSSARLLLRCFEELETETAPNALQRSILALWTEDFLTADEPILLPAGKNAPASTSGQHPLLWSGYMCFGN
ncbi:MAG: hypothetical protein R3C53_01455 [Pirellulaceae bacterium]